MPDPSGYRGGEVIVFIEDNFAAAHWLPNVPEGHKCRRMHGHTYYVRIEISGPVGETTGWVLDYATIKQSWKPLFNKLDHQTLNNLIENPTAEHIAAWIGAGMGPWCSRVTLYETPDAGVIWEPEK